MLQNCWSSVTFFLKYNIYSGISSVINVNKNEQMENCLIPNKKSDIQLPEGRNQAFFI